jgi:hypothetical protein
MSSSNNFEQRGLIQNINRAIMEMDGNGWTWMEMDGNGWKWMDFSMHYMGCGTMLHHKNPHCLHLLIIIASIKMTTNWGIDWLNPTV